MRRSPITKSSALPWERAAFIRARAVRRRSGARPLFPRGDPPVRLAALARFRRDRRDPRDQPPDPRPLCARPGVRPGLRPEARPRRHPRGRVLRPDPPAHPWRPRAGAARGGRRSTRWPALAKAGRIGARGGRGAARGLSAVPNDRASAADGRRPPDPQPARRSGRARQCRPAARAGRRRRLARLCCARMSSGSARSTTRSRPRRRRAAAGGAAARWTPRWPRRASPRRRAARARIEGWRSGKVRSLRTAPARDAVRGDAAGADRGASARRPTRCAR